MVQHRVEETLGLAAAGTGRHQGVCGQMLTGEPLPGAFLVAVAWISGREVGEEIAARLALHEG